MLKTIPIVISYLAFLCINLTAQVISIPADYATIQEGINAAAEGDTVMVSPGTYIENVELDGKNVTLASLFLITGDTSYISSTIIDGGFNGTVLTVGNGIDSTTLIKGFTITNGTGQYQGGGIYIFYSSPVFDHLRIVGNNASDGGGVFILNDCASVFRHCLIKGNTASNSGGGMCIFPSSNNDSCKLIDLLIADNSADYGGGVMNFSAPILKRVKIRNNSAHFGGGMCNYGNALFDSVDRCSIYLNSAGVGSELWADDSWGNTAHIVLDTFTVLIPTEFHAHNLGLFSFDILNGKFNQAEADLYVSPNGSDENSGLNADDPLKTINHALTIIQPDTSLQRQINLLAGTYCPTTNGEFFPVNLIDRIDISGVADSLVVLNADSASRVMHLYGNGNNSVSGITITGGFHDSGAGILISNSSPSLEFLTISGNVSTGNGGGISVLQAGSNPSINQVIIDSNSAINGGGIYNNGNLEMLNSSVINNISSESGGGIYCGDSAFIVNTVITGNEAEDGAGFYFEAYSYADLDSVSIKYNHGSKKGGGIYCGEYSLTIIQNTCISDNYSGVQGGGMYCQDSSLQEMKSTLISFNHAELNGGGIFNPSPNTIFDSLDRCNIFLNNATFGNDLFGNNPSARIIVDTFTVYYPTEFHACNRANFIFDILAGKIEQVNADLYIAPTGDDNNSGATPGDPLKTIHRAYLKLDVDQDHPHTIHLANGTYSASATGETFPIHMVNFSSLSGDGQLATILDAESENRVIYLNNDSIPYIRNLTIRNGNSSSGVGGGIYCSESEVAFNNVTIEECEAYYAGGGIYVGSNSKLSVINSVIRNNLAEKGGGISFNTFSNSIIKNSVIESNSADLGGGIFTYAGLQFDHVDFKYNNAINGGALALSGIDSTQAVHLENSRFIANSAEQRGGGLYSIHCSDLSVINCAIDSNTAAQAAGFYIENSTTAIKSSLVTNNIAYSQWGGGVFYNDYNVSESPNADLYNVTFANNSNIGLFGFRTGIRLVNSIFWNNSGPAQIQLNLSANDNDTLWVEYSDIQDGEEGLLLNGPVHLIWNPNNLSQDPLFNFSGDHPFSLEDGSPCIDTGTPDTAGLVLPDNDILGNTRVWDGVGNGEYIIDMGPYEFGAPVNVTDKFSQDYYDTNDFHIYPNPAKHLTKIELEINEAGLYNIAMYSMTGQRLIKTQEIHYTPGAYNIHQDVSILPNGIYCLMLQRNGAVISSTKLIKSGE
ncbi:MAG: T9SS type A sorting domain-containing protein [Bacteroidales bacterium]